MAVERLMGMGMVRDQSFGFKLGKEWTYFLSLVDMLVPQALEALRAENHGQRDQTHG